MLLPLVALSIVVVAMLGFEGRAAAQDLEVPADVDTIMRTAAQEVGRALGRQTFVYLRDGDEEVEQVEDS